jgi:hypothetical protein
MDCKPITWTWNPSLKNVRIYAGYSVARPYYFCADMFIYIYIYISFIKHLYSLSFDPFQLGTMHYAAQRFFGPIL